MGEEDPARFLDYFAIFWARISGIFVQIIHLQKPCILHCALSGDVTRGGAVHAARGESARARTLCESAASALARARALCESAASALARACACVLAGHPAAPVSVGQGGRVILRCVFRACFFFSARDAARAPLMQPVRA